MFLLLLVETSANLAGSTTKTDFGAPPSIERFIGCGYPLGNMTAATVVTSVDNRDSTIAFPGSITLPIL